MFLKAAGVAVILLGLVFARHPAMAADWTLSSEVAFYTSTEPKSDKEFVGRPLVAASKQEACTDVWKKVENKLEGADNYLILQIVPRYSCPLFIRAIYRKAGSEEWKSISSAKGGVFEVPVGAPMAEELLSHVEAKDQFDTSFAATDNQWHTMITANVNGAVVHQGFLDMSGAGDLGHDRLFAKLYFFARSIESLTEFGPGACNRK